LNGLNGLGATNLATLQSHRAIESAIFCGFNGATRKPRRLNTRHKPATVTLLPASEVVP
jgi:hypothetical protein